MHRASPFGMVHAQTPLQEVANSVSMVIPAGVIFYYWLNPPHDTFWNEYTGALAYGTLLHLPFSFFYHLLCAFRVFKDPVDCIPRKLDQVGIPLPLPLTLSCRKIPPPESASACGPQRKVVKSNRPCTRASPILPTLVGRELTPPTCGHAWR